MVHFTPEYSPNSKAITIPHEQLDLIPLFIDEDENISTHQVMWNMFSHQTRQAAEALAHIRSLAKKEVPLMGEKTKHGDPCRPVSGSSLPYSCHPTQS